MKNAFVTGLILGIMSGTWLFIMRSFGYTSTGNHVRPIEYLSLLIPFCGVYFGVKTYREDDKEGEISFFEALFQSFRILLIGGLFACLAGIVYINYFDMASNLFAFSGRLFGGLALGVLICVGSAAALMNKPSKLD
ncbi:DUF4199 domain-containing protein [Mucilaginibacter dorajii]|uniref:DUF4199 domain-containing protein n=1 Tax=Mucilaginibacter dorajii TaxID=692994 RepID=A0ABP7QV81_9SPHI|nr:DUF4199 domain-containing protein [Mucilaginibacter dorajii]MCS3736243.1 hypothetical protein [Mucilaginibacter dorajii]